VLSVAAVLWWPRHPALDAAYRPAGWLTAWYGFNVLSPRSLAGDRTMAILGFFGIVNFIAGVFLLRRNHIAGWLTITPLLALCLPFAAIPFANALAKRSVPDILAFHRMLLAIPSGLAIVGLGTEVANRKSQVPGPKFQAASLDSGTSEQPSAYNLRPASRSLSEGGLSASGLSIFSLFLLIFTAVLLVPANGPHYNRFWNVLMVPASDLAMSPVLEAAGGPSSGEPRGQFSYRSGSLPMADTQLFTTPSAGLVIMSSGERNVAYIENKLVLFPVPSPPSARIGHLLNWILTTNRKNVLLLLPPVSSIQTPISLTGYLSTHWLPQEMALDYTGNLEIETTARALGGRETKTPAATYYSFGDWKAATQQSK
jgi:hypothetical protein